MDQTINFCLSIIRYHNLKIDIYELRKLQGNANNFYTYLFKQLNSKDLDTLITNCFSYIFFVPILYFHYPYLCYKTSIDVSIKLFEYLVSNNIDPLLLLELINISSTNDNQYKRITSYLNRNITPYSKLFRKENKLLYELKDKIDDKYSELYGNKFENLIIFPLSRKNGNQYLDYAFRQLETDINKVEMLPSGIGNFSWAFKLNDNLVLKTSYTVITWYIPMFYRINDFVIRRNFGKNVISVSPYAETNSIDNEDIKNALADFDKAGLVLTDGNYASNFGVIDYQIPDSMFRDVYGITKYLDIPESNHYKDKKVKLIDQDFIYFKDAKQKEYGAPVKFK